MSPANATYPEELCLREVGGPEGGEAHEHAQLQQASLKKGKSTDGGSHRKRRFGGTDGRTSEGCISGDPMRVFTVDGRIVTAVESIGRGRPSGPTGHPATAHCQNATKDGKNRGVTT